MKKKLYLLVKKNQLAIFLDIFKCLICHTYIWFLNFITNGQQQPKFTINNRNYNYT